MLAVIFAMAVLGAPAGPGSHERAVQLDEMAGAETSRGEYAAAIGHATEAAAIFGQLSDGARRGIALNRIGLAHLYAGEYREAMPHFESAIATSAAANDHSARVEAMSNLANVFFFLGRYSDAEATYDAALQVANAHLPAAWAQRRQRLLLINQATLDQKLGRYEQALEHYDAVQAAHADLPPDEQAQLLTNLGVLYRRLGDPIKALKAYDDARALFAREHHLDGELSVMKNRGIVLALDLRQLEAARQNFSEAFARASRAANRREMLQAQLYRGETELRLGNDASALVDFHAALATAEEMQTPEEQWKARFGLARVALRAGRRDEAAGELERAVGVIEGMREAIRIPTLRSDYFNDKREVYDALIAIALERNDAARLFELIDRSHSRVWRERLGLVEAVSLAAVQRALPAGVLLIETWVAHDAAAIVFVTRDDVQVKRGRIDPATLASLDRDLARPSGNSRAAAAALAKTLLPDRLPERCAHAIVIPDGALSLVPFELLPAGDRMLVERVSVSYAPTAGVLLRPASTPPANPSTELIAFATGSTPSSIDEVQSIASELGGHSVLHTGADSRKAHLFDANPAAPLLHIASHAVADETAMERSRIEFAPLSGRSEPDYLFLKEAYELPLKNVELAVLSACETERGRIVAGEGIQSFSRAFLAAGARSTVTTLWRVPDAPTASFMEAFYEHLQRGESRAEALRSAKLSFVRSARLRDPHYWAAFVLTGDALTPIPRVTKWSGVTVGIGVVAVVVALAGSLLFWRRRV